MYYVYIYMYCINIQFIWNSLRWCRITPSRGWVLWNHVKSHRCAKDPVVQLQQTFSGSHGKWSTNLHGSCPSSSANMFFSGFLRNVWKKHNQGFSIDISIIFIWFVNRLPKSVSSASNKDTTFPKSIWWINMILSNLCFLCFQFIPRIIVNLDQTGIIIQERSGSIVATANSCD